jgi:hypothetical protein
VDFTVRRFYRQLDLTGKLSDYAGNASEKNTNLKT